MAIPVKIKNRTWMEVGEGQKQTWLKCVLGIVPWSQGNPALDGGYTQSEEPAARLMKQNKCHRNSVRNTECNRRSLCAHHSGEGGKVNCGNNSSPEGSEFLAGTVFLVSWWTDKGNLLCKCTVSIVVLRPFLESCWKYCLLPFVLCRQKPDFELQKWGRGTGSWALLA